MSYLDRVNPNLALVLHYVSKTTWLVLAAVFGNIGLSLYRLGVTTTGTAITKIWGVEVALKDAGPGLVVMVVALVCALVGAVRAKVVMTPTSITLTTPPVPRGDSRGSVEVVPIEAALRGVEAPSTIADLELTWGLTEVAMLRVPIGHWASAEELAQLRDVLQASPLSGDWPRRATAVARLSPGFADFLRKLGSPERRTLGLTEQVASLDRVDFSLPWCARLRWGSGNIRNVDLFVCATGGAGDLTWNTIVAPSTKS